MQYATLDASVQHPAGEIPNSKRDVLRVLASVLMALTRHRIHRIVIFVAYIHKSPYLNMVSLRRADKSCALLSEPVHL